MSEDKPPKPPSKGRRWTSFVAAPEGKARVPRMLVEETKPVHRLRVEHDAYTLLIHLSDEDGKGWTTIAVDRATRQFAVAQGGPKAATGPRAYERLYGP